MTAGEDEAQPVVLDALVVGPGRLVLDADSYRNKREAALTARKSVADENEDSVVMTELFFVPGSTYRLLRAQSTQITVGGLVEVEGERYRVARMGPSPLPGDSRRCAYLVAGGPPGAAPDA